MIKFTQVVANVDGQNIYLQTDYPDNPDNGYYYGLWTPSGFGDFDMTVSVTQSGDKTTSYTNHFEVTNDIDSHFDDIIIHESEIESRLIGADCTIGSLKADNRTFIHGFQSAGEQVVLIESDYEQAIKNLWIDT